MYTPLISVVKRVVVVGDKVLVGILVGISAVVELVFGKSAVVIGCTDVATVLIVELTVDITGGSSLNLVVLVMTLEVLILTCGKDSVVDLIELSVIIKCSVGLADKCGFPSELFHFLISVGFSVVEKSMFPLSQEYWKTFIQKYKS